MKIEMTRATFNALFFATAFSAVLPALANAADDSGLYPTGVVDQLGKASSCMSCHGPGGISQSPEWPNIAGQKAPYLESQLKAFRDGKRKNGMMENITKNLSAADMKQLAKYFSELPVDNQ
ncbi:c-type cytochrome [Pseudomonas cerasi]